VNKSQEMQTPFTQELEKHSASIVQIAPPQYEPI
jgi:hypothetical protein